ncbi:hypothetical protein [Poseidonocella sp. HB161398]|uniref:hypothetical protein n=1 Tax=Poseidonocella sp. HB161398 TaxID=2320855 RepID=UPI0014866818|nr:hypothetical protein [Poseidonocella sp. HB161398]
MQGILTGLGFSLVTALVVILGDLVIKLAADRGAISEGAHFLTGGCLLYLVSALMWFLAMRHIPLGAAAVAYSGFTLLGACALGVLVFGEPFRLREALGIACALASVLLMLPSE